jgi:hypothetical protein
VHFAVSNPDLASESGPFTLAGARPLLLFVLARDVPAGRRFVGELVRRVRLEHITVRGHDDEVAESEWAPFEGFGGQVQRAVRADNGGAADDVVVDRVRRTGDALTVPVQCSIRGRSRIRIEGSLAEGALPPPPFARISFSWRRGEHTAGELALPPEPIATRAGPFVANPTLDCTVMPPGASRYDLLLWGRWELDDAAFGEQWFVRESADTSYDMPERVYGLAALARAVIDLSVRREGALDRVTFAVERE